MSSNSNAAVQSSAAAAKNFRYGEKSGTVLVKLDPSVPGR